MTLLALAPNWLGDAVMALPALADLRRHTAGGRLVVAARPRVAALFDLVPGVDCVLRLSAGGAWAWRALAKDVRLLREAGASTAILFPNSWQAALMVHRAGVPQRWGYSRDGRGLLLTRRVPRARGVAHQVDRYRQLVASMGVENGPREPAVDVPARVTEAARAAIVARGWDGSRPLVGFAPGAAYGGAKRWPPDRVTDVVARLVAGHDAVCVLVGGAAETRTTRAVAAEAGKIVGPALAGRVIDLAGATTIVQLAGVLAACSAFVSNDSGAMHLAAAVGTPVVAMFGPTDERATAPVARDGGTAAIVAGAAWCRPCGLRECPIDHRCMTSIPADAVVRAAGEIL